MNKSNKSRAILAAILMNASFPRVALVILLTSVLLACSSSSAYRSGSKAGNTWGVSDVVPSLISENTVGQQDKFWVINSKVIRVLGDSIGNGPKTVVQSELDGSNEIRVPVLDLVPKEETLFGFHELKSGSLLYYLEDRDLLVRVCGKSILTCGKPSIVNEEKMLGVPRIRFLETGNDRLTVLWLTSSVPNGTFQASISDDGGKTWSPPTSVVGGLEQVRLDGLGAAVGVGDRIHAVWENWASVGTLVDIFYAYSDDGGRRWSKIRKINDDSKPVWQLRPQIVTFGNKVLVSFDDFREDGPFNDRDWNVYYALSDDNGSTWRPNKRLNRKTYGRQGESALFLTSSNRLLSFFLTGEATIFTQLAVAEYDSYADSWSEANLITPPTQRLHLARSRIAPWGERLLVSFSVVDHDYDAIARKSFLMEEGGKKRNAENASCEKTVSFLSNWRDRV